MDTAAPRPILLKDYKPPNYLIDTVSLDVALEPERTRVRSRLQMRANPDYPGKPGALKLDGELLALEKVTLDGRELDARRLPGDGPQPDDCQAAGRSLQAGDRHGLQSEGQHGADGPLPVEGHLLHAVRGAGLPPHHLFPRSPGCAGHLHGAHRGRPQRDAGAALQRQPARARHARRRQAALCGVARSAPQALLPVRAGGRQSRLARLRLHHRVGPQGRPAHLRGARQGGPLRLGHGLRSSAPCAGTRSASGASTTSTCSTSSPCPTSTWGRWRTRASTSSTTAWCWPRPRPPPTTPSWASSASSRTSTSTTGPATASPAATGSSSASRKA